MSTYIKQLIDAYGNNLIPVSGTASCYNSDGLTVDEIIENLKSDMKGIIPITWAKLKALKSSKLLSPGKVYCITDYKTVSTQSGTKTTGNNMQILVQALSKDTLSEDAIGLLKSGSGQDIHSGTVLVKKALMGDNYTGVYMIDEGCQYFFHDMYELGGTTYYRWIKYNSDDLMAGDYNNPLYILTTTDEYDFSNGQKYLPDLWIKIDKETGDVNDSYVPNKEKFIMGIEEVEIPLRLYVDEFNSDYPYVLDVNEFWSYKDTFEIGGTTYYRWSKFEDGVEVSGNSVHFLLTDTLDYTFNGVEAYDLNMYLTVDESGFYEPDIPKGEKVVDTNYKFAFSSGSGKNETLDLKYSLEDYSRFTWVTQNEAYEIYTDDGYWFTLDGTVDINGTTYHKWYSAGMGENSRLLSTTLNLNLSDKVDYISNITDVNTFQSSHSTITDIKTNQVSPQDFKGTIYYMKDTNNNEAPYDFKNIIFSGHYTFDLTGTDYSSSSYCYENIIKPYRKSGQQILNNIVFLNEKNDEYCKANYIEPDTHDISYGPRTSDLDTRLILGEY